MTLNDWTTYHLSRSRRRKREKSSKFYQNVGVSMNVSNFGHCGSIDYYCIETTKEKKWEILNYDQWMNYEVSFSHWTTITHTNKQCPEAWWINLAKKKFISVSIYDIIKLKHKISKIHYFVIDHSMFYNVWFNWWINQWYKQIQYWLWFLKSLFNSNRIFNMKMKKKFHAKLNPKKWFDCQV